MEIERKWLVTEELILPQLKDGVRIEQHYINGSTDEWVIRARKYGVQYFLTLKGQWLLARPELEYQITEAQYYETIKHSMKSIKKTRYYIPVDDDLEYEIDVYDFYNFLTCEVEFKSEEQAKEFKAPGWCWTEVTDNPAYQNVNLARPKEK